MADKTNLAYDLSRYEEYEENAKLRRQIKSHKNTKPKNVIATPTFVLLLLAMGGMLILCITSKADIATVHAEIIAQEAVVHTLEQENVNMSTRLEQKSSQKVVEDYAENILGMQKLDNAQVEYVSLESGNKVEIAEKNDNVFTQIKTAFDNFVEYLKG